METMETRVSSQNPRSHWLKHLIGRWSLIIGILLSAAFLRLFRIADYLTFLGDEGRDVLIVKHLLEGDLIGLGPTSSVGGFFTGPIYYYFMAPFLWLFKLDPAGPAVMVALFGIATVFLIYIVGKDFFGKKAGLVAASLYTVSPLVLGYSRSSWNPNLMPFFSLLIIFLLYKSVKKQSNLLLIAIGFLFGIALQLHYIETFLATIAVVYIFLAKVIFDKSLPITKRLLTVVKDYVSIFLGFLVGFSPFLAFEATHGFPNIKTIVKFIFGSEETGFSGGNFFAIVADVLFRLFGRLLIRFPPADQVSQLYSDEKLLMFVWQLGIVILIVCSIFALLYLFKKHYGERSQRLKYLLLLLWLAMGVLLFGFYQKPIYDYYFQFMFPLPFLLAGNFLSIFYGYSFFGKFGKVLSVVIFVGLFLFNLDGMPFKYAPNRQLRQVRTISEFVLDKAEGRPFNFALITSGNSDHAYRYFFELEGNTPVVIQNAEIDPQRTSIADQLLVVCESIPCAPLGHSLFEIAGYGRAEIVGGPWDVSVVRIYKLGHYKGE